MTQSPDTEEPRALDESSLGDVVVLIALSLTAPLLLISMNTPQGISPIRPMLFASVMVGLGVAAAAVLKGRIGWSRALLIAAAAVVVSYEWGKLTDIPKDAGFGCLPGSVVPLVVLLVVGRLIRRAKSVVAVRWVMLALSSGSFIIAIPPLLEWYGGAPDPPIPSAMVELAEVERPDVVVIVLDGYGRGDVLSDLYGFDNSPMLRELEDSGFVVLQESRANYSMTIASLSSALSLKYIFPEGESPTERGEIAMRAAIAGDNTFFRTLVSAGYRIEYFESGWEGSQCGDLVTKCHEASPYDELGALILDATPFASLATNIYGGPFIHNGRHILNELPATLTEEPQHPRLVFAHVMLPHPPVFLASDCSLDTHPDREGTTLGRPVMSTDERLQRREHYVEQIQCVNSMLANVLDFVGKDDIAVVIGDHGPDSFGQPTLDPKFWTPEVAWERMSVLNALRIPASCSELAYPAMTLVNTFRLVLRCLGADLEFLADRSYLYPHLRAWPVEDRDSATSLLLEDFLR